MNTQSRSTSTDWLIGGTLLLMLVLTRSGHFGSSLKLPDASWAMFWLGGALALRWWWPAIMLVASAAIDYFVISNGVSSYCVTPAYPFIIPAYFSLWFAGRWIAGHLNADAQSLLRTGISILGGVTFAFIITNVGFYLFAGYFSSMPAWTYLQAVVKYWPGYMLHTSIYAVTGLLIRYIVVSLRNSASTQSASS
ncbi:MAG TPA: hypothetical protein VHL14_08270 [Steroidobacteraceae bacterium]|nr:hypothetical protein [Steroidobacteraceae bacterium]